MLWQRHTFLQVQRLAFKLSGMELSERLKKARKAAGLTQVELAERAGIKQASVSEIERGLTRTSGHLVKFAKICGVEPLWLSEGVGPERAGSTGSGSADEVDFDANVVPTPAPSRYFEYPEISWVQAGIAAEAIDLFNVGDFEAMHPSDAWAGPNGYWLKVKGPSMTTTNGISFNEGMVILVAPNADVESGQFCVAKLIDTNEVTFKQFIWDSGRAYLKPLNSAFPTVEVDDTWSVIGKVVDAKWPRSIL